MSDRTGATATDDQTRDRVARVLNAIRPAIQADGGDVELVEITPDGVVSIRLHGACVGCPSSNMTLQVGIERNLREHVPEITGVRAVE
ncbi:MAG: NifU family protein [Phycisphaerales bacterium]|nr:MAG: NifU family protein [Phycisphaerales bacterium]